VGIQGGTRPTDPAVERLLPILRKVSALDDKNIKPLNDPHRIFFIHEIGAFPLRLIEGIEKMRSVYRSVSQSERQNPLHTHQDNRRFKDILPAPQEEMQVKQNLRLAIALGLITPVENKTNGYTEVRFYYRDRQTGLEKHQTLGASVREAEEFLLGDANRSLRDILEDALKQIGQSAATKPDKQALYDRLMSYLKQLEATTPYGKDSPEYQQMEVAIADFIKTYTLFIAPTVTTPVTAPVSPPSPTVPAATVASSGSHSSSSNENLEKFRKLAQTCYRKGNPTETERQLLEKCRQRYQIPPDLAAQVIAEVSPKASTDDAIQEYALMYRAFIENDGEIDLEEQTQLMDLQEELGLSTEQVNLLEQNIRDELSQR
jgi:hypothetical protein